MKRMVQTMYGLLLAAVVAATAIGLAVAATSIRVYKGTQPHALRHLADIPSDAWGRLSERTIFFGHRSVGRDILDGIRDLAADHGGVHLRVVEMEDPNDIPGPGLTHALVGRNLDPESKIIEFTRLMDSGFGEKVDIAFFKFCFVDIGRTSNPDAIFTSYCNAMDLLRSRFPRVVFVHVTAPLCGPPGRVRGMLKASVKRLIGRPPVLEENQARSRYNTLLRERFSGKEPLFDLALYEGIDPEGLRHYGLRSGREVPLLVRSYTDDGGHLNATGRRHVAEQLLIQLASLPCGVP